MNNNQKISDQKLTELFMTLGLPKTEATEIIQAVRKRGFTGAIFVSVALCTAGMLDLNPHLSNIDEAITAAVEFLAKSHQVITQQFNIFEEPDDDQ